jgi:hypothetical protein
MGFRIRVGESEDEMSSENVPVVTCSKCGTKANCARLSDGAIYKPASWQYPDKANPFDGLCLGCQDTAADRFNAMGYVHIC